MELRRDSLLGTDLIWNMVRIATDQAEPFWIGETAVTFELFDVWALQLDLSQERQVAGVDAISRPSKPYSVIFTNFGHRGFPAICMSNRNAIEFCNWLSGLTGKRHRLPTRIEWQTACLGGQSRYVGTDTNSWNWENADDLTHLVGKKEPNCFGLFDMLGNVAEHTAEGIICGGSWKTKLADLDDNHAEQESAKWNEADPQNPKSVWWLANGQHIGMRLACDEN